MKDQTIKYSESGRTMLEMLGVLAIMGIIMYGAIAGINYGMSTYKINQTFNEVQDAVQGIQDLYSWSTDYSKLQQSHMCDNDIFTNCSGSTISSPFGTGDIQVAPSSDNKSFVITYFAIEQANCNRLKEMEWGVVMMDSSCANSTSNDIKFCPKTEANQTNCP